MLVKDKFLEKIKYFIFIIIILFSQNLIGKNIKSKIDNYNNNLKNSSALFIQSDGMTLEEGVIYFGVDRIKIDYSKPKKLTLILSEEKGMYINHSLKESQYFSTKKSHIKIFFKILKGESFTETTNVSSNFIELIDSFTLNDIQYKIKIIYEDDPIKLRKIIILENNQKTEMGLFNHNNLKTLNKKFFSMVDPYLN
jgi:hypothetical protein